MKTNEDLMSNLIYNAEQGKHRQFQLLKSPQEYYNARVVRRAHTLLVASIKQSTDKQFKKYCKAVSTGDADVLNLLVYRTTMNILRYYEEELNIIKDMIDEYETYLAYGNLVDFIFGFQRPVDKLFDHRGQ